MELYDKKNRLKFWDKHTGKQFGTPFHALKWAQENKQDITLMGDEFDGPIVSYDHLTNFVTWYDGSSPLTALTLTKAAKLLGVTYERARDFCQEGRIGSRFGKSWMITRHELEEFAMIPRHYGIRRGKKK